MPAGISGTDHVAKAAPDGYTFVLSVNAPLVYDTVLFKTLPYDPFKDLTPVSLAVTTPNVCAVSNGFGVDSVAGWLDALRRNPDKYNFASTGNGSIAHLGCRDDQSQDRLQGRARALHLIGSGRHRAGAGRRAVRVSAARHRDADGRRPGASRRSRLRRPSVSSRWPNCRPCASPACPNCRSCRGTPTWRRRTRRLRSCSA